MVVVCGEALVDLVPVPGGLYAAVPGGSPANVAVALGRLGVPAHLLARLSRDHFGQSIRRHLLASHVDLSLAVETDQRSTVARLTLDAGGDASYTFFVTGGADDGWRPRELPPRLPPGEALHVAGSFALAVESMGDAIEALLAREHGDRLISFDPNPRPALTPDVASLRRRLERWVGYADIVKLSADDVAWTYPGRELADVAARWLSAGPALVVVTRGGDGVFALGPTGATELAAPAVEVVDTVGAGDAFTAGLLAALHDQGRLDRAGVRALGAADLDAALRHGQRVAALTCARRGADPPWRHELTPVTGAG